MVIPVSSVTLADSMVCAKAWSEQVVATSSDPLTALESQIKACQRYELEGTPWSYRVAKVWSGGRGCEPLVKEACG